mgnify:CR=1 FL=1
MINIIEIYQEQNSWVVKYDENGQIKFSEPLSSYEDALAVSVSLQS